MNKPSKPAHGMVRYAQMLHTAAGKLKYTQETLDRATLKELLAVTPPEVIKAAADVVLTERHYETGTDEGFSRTYRKYPTTYNQVRVYAKSVPRMVKREYIDKDGRKHVRTVKSGSGKKHKCIIRFFGPPKATTPCWVWCDCEAFTFNLEVALSELNSSDVKLSNGEKPQVRNPAMLGYLCKHLYAAAKHFALGLDKDLALEKYNKEEAKKADEKDTSRKLKRFR